MSQRRHDLDSLRILVFGVLILWHSAMMFTETFSSPQFRNNIVFKDLDIILIFFHWWRMPLLFLISGFAGGFAIMKFNSPQAYIRKRFIRLMIPLLFAIYFIFLPLEYAGHLLEGKQKNFFNFLINDYIYSPWHLWFVQSLFIFTIFMTPIMFKLKERKNTWLERYTRALVVHKYTLGGMIPFSFATGIITCIQFIPGIGSFETGYLSIKSISGTIYYSAFFAIGFILFLVRDDFTTAIIKRKHAFIFISICCFTVSLFFIKNVYAKTATANELLIFGCCYFIFIYSMIFCCLGYAAEYLYRKHRILDYLNEAIYPCFILHMPINIIIATPLAPISMNPLVKYIIINILLFSGCGLIYHLMIRPFNIMRILFGMNTVKQL